MMVNNGINNMVLSGWWFGTMEFYDLPFSWEFQKIPTDELHFSEGLKPPTS
jgi:hypothetical protein